MINENSIFQHDNASSHKAKNTTDWLDKKGVEILNWPSHSPDLSPIENVWPHIMEHISKNMDKINNSDDMFKIAEKFFYESQIIK